MVALPSPLAVTSPLSVTSTIAGSLVLQRTPGEEFSAYDTEQVRVCFFPKDKISGGFTISTTSF